MNFQIQIKKSVYMITQYTLSYDDLLDQVRNNIPNIPNLFKISYITNQNDKIAIKSQGDLEVLCKFKSFAILLVESRS